MVLTLVLPDEQTWTMSGLDPGPAEPVFEPARARRVLLPYRVPDVLMQPLADTLASLPHGVETIERRVPYPGDASPHDAPAHGEHGKHDGHDEHDEHDEHGEHDAHGGHAGHGGHDHGDMMAIVGDPSADGLVMEPIELRFGPLGTPLPAGIVADVTLDGDVVAAAQVQALFGAGVRRDTPDPLAQQAWDLAQATGSPQDRWERLAAVELERAVSHTAWLRSFARVLGWPELVARATHALARLAEAPADARPALGGLADLAESSRRLRWRTAGRGRITPERARELGLHGPPARAAGLPDDARSEDPLYRQLGFEPVVRSDGDALARTQVRAAEAVAAVELAIAASARTDAPPGGAARAVEGPRGPLRVEDGRLEAPGETAALTAAGAAMIGAEWASALAVLASFDLSPWRVTA
jgi:hypothetical protein